MPQLEARGLSKYYGATPIIRDASFTFHHGGRIGVIGRNGQGKTTLLRLLGGLDEPDEGELSFAGGTRTGLLTQEQKLPETSTLYEFALEARQDLIELEQRLRQLERQLSREAEDDNDSGRLLKKYDRLREQYEREGGYQRESDARAVLAGLGFSEEEFELTLDALSGGQRVRARLARLLLVSPDLLLLDEPTNHLDLEATEWLENYLNDYEGTVVCVSHDRYFLDEVVERILEVERAAITTYDGNYSAYEKERARRRKQQKKKYERQQEEIERLKAFIRRYKAGQRSKEAQGRERRLERMEAVEKPTAELPTMVVDFTPDRTTGFEVCQVKNLSKSYGANELFRSFNTTIYQGQCIGILGPNGSGKTTLLKALAGRLEPDTGSTTWGTGVKLGYFSQRLDDFEEQRTVLAEFRAHCELNIPEARQFLAGFLFRGDDVFEEVQNLSGGERNRLQLAKLSVSGANVLLLDEPTNHLDIPSRQALEAALSEFSGTILFITHDRYLLNQLASHIWDLDSSRIEVFHGNYDELKRQRAREARLSSANEKTENREHSAQADGSSEQESEHSRLSTYKLNLLLEQTEERIDELEEEKQEYQEQLANPQTYKQADVGELVNAFDEVKAELERLYDNWVHYKQELDERR